jgi:hypothetical protein
MRVCRRLARARTGCGMVVFLLVAAAMIPAAAQAAPGALWTTPLSSAGSFIYGSPTGGFLLDRWDGTSLDPVVGTASDAQFAVADHDADVAPVFDAAGDVYRWGSTVTGSTEEVALEMDSAGGQVMWRTPLDAEQPYDLILGTNHDLYASYFSNAGGWHLLRLDANTGQVLWDDVGPDGVPQPTLAGVALVSAGQMQLVGSDQSNDGTVAYAAGNSPELYSVAHNDQGDILALNLPQWSSGSCGYTAGPATITELGPSGTQQWTRQLPMSGCVHPSVAALPTGSWAVSDQGNGAILGLSGTDGSTLWTASTHPHNYGPFILGSDANGDVYAAQNLVTRCVPEPADTTNCQGEEILKISGLTGSSSSVLQLIDTSASNTITLGLENTLPGRYTNTPASIAPGRLFTVEDDLVGNPRSFTNSQWSFNGYSLPTGTPYPTPPDEGGGSAIGGGSSQSPPVSGGGGVGNNTSGSSSGGWSSSHSCAPTRGSIGKRLLASLKCSLLNAVSFAECGYGIAQYLVLPLDAAKTARGLYDLRKIRKVFRPLAKLWNDILRTKFSRHAPNGFRTGKQVIGKLKEAKRAYQVIRILPNLIKALSKADYEKIIDDIVKIAGLEPCVKGIINGIES